MSEGVMVGDVREPLTGPAAPAPHDPERLQDEYIARIHATFDSLFQTLPEGIPEQIANSIREDIYRGALSPGQWIREVELANRFHTSRGPVRKALDLLHKNDGLVEILPRRGARVAVYTRQDIVNLYDVRATLLGLAARLAAEARDRSFVAMMREGLDLLERMIERDEPDPARFSDVRDAALVPMLHAAQNQRVLDFLAKLERQVIASKHHILNPERCRHIVTLMTDLVAALGAGAADRAELVARSMLWSARDAVLHQHRLLNNN